MRITARSLTAYSPLQTKLDMIHMVKSRINQNTAFAEGIIRRCMSAGDYDFPPASFVFIDTGEKKADYQAADSAARLLITLNHYYMSQDVRIQNEYFISQLYRQIDYYMNQLRLNSCTEFRELNKIYKQIQNFNIYTEQQKLKQDRAEILDGQLEKILRSIENRESERQQTILLSEKRLLNQETGGRVEKTKSLSLPFYRMIGQVLQSSRVNDYKTIWRQSVSRQYSLEAREFLNYLEHLNVSERKSVLEMLGEEEYSLYGKLRKMERGQWRNFAGQMAGRIEKSLRAAHEPGGHADGQTAGGSDSGTYSRSDSRTPAQILESPIEPENWLSFIEEIHRSTSLEEEFYNYFQENKRSFTTSEKNVDILENRNLILKNEFLRLLEQTEESEDVEQIWNLAGLDHVLKESAEKWRNYEAETLYEKKEQIKEWIGYIDSSLWERFLTLLSTKKELEALTEESYQYSQVIKSGQMKQSVGRPGKQSFERGQRADERVLVRNPQVVEQVLVREKQAVIEYLRREQFQHMDADSAEWKELSQVFGEKFLEKENVGIESVNSELVNSEAWLSFIEEIHKSTSLEKEFYSSLQENRRSFTTFEKNSDILEKQDLILKNKFFRLLEQTEESEDVEQIWKLAGLDHVLKESAEEWRNYEAETLSEKKEQIKEWIGYMDSSLWERFLTLLSSKKELEALTEESYQYSQVIKSGQMKPPVGHPGKHLFESNPHTDEQILVEEPQVGRQVLVREQQAVIEYLRGKDFQHMDLNSVEGKYLSQIFAEKFLGKENTETESVNSEAWFSFIEEIHKNTSLEKEFYDSFLENRQSLTTLEKNRDILEKQDLILKNEFFRLLEQTEESEDVEQIWKLASLDHALKESAEEWRNYETETLSEKKEQIKEWIGYIDSSLWERFLTLLSTKKELEAMTEESYQYSQVIKSGQMKQSVGRPGKQSFERDQRADERVLVRNPQVVEQVLVRELQTSEGGQEREQVLIREQQAVIEYLRREQFQHMDTNSAEWKELSRVFVEKFLEKENVGIESVNSEAWLSFIEEIHKNTSLENEFYNSLQENRQSFATFEKNTDILENRGLILKNEFFRLLEQTDESEAVEQIWNLASLDHALKESADEWRNYETETLFEKKEQIKEWIGYMDSSLWERFLTLLSTKKELEALTEESYQYNQMVKSGRMKQPVERPGKQNLERDRWADEQILVEEQQVGEQVLVRERQAVIEYFRRERFQHMDLNSVEGEDLSQIFAEKFLGKVNVETESVNSEPVNSEAWLSFIEEIHNNTSLEKEFYKSFQENRQSFITLEKNRDILEKQDLILKNEFFRLLEQTEESEDVEQIWKLAGLDHALKESAEEWRNYETETLSEKKEQIKEWIGYMDSSLWERFLTLLSSKKELEALTEESYQYSQVIKSGQMKPPVGHPGKHIFERNPHTDKQILVEEPKVDRQVLVREQQAVMEYLRGEKFQHIDTYSVEGKELSQIFAEKFLGKVNVETESVNSEPVNSEAWLSFIEEIHNNTSLEKEFYKSFQENRQSFITLEKNRDILEKQDLILKNEFFRLLEQTEESEDVEQIWKLASLDHALKESAEEWRNYEAETLSEKKEQIKEWIGYMDSSLWERFLTLLSTKKELEALTKESYQYYSQTVKSSQKETAFERPGKQIFEKDRWADEQILVKEPQVDGQVLAREQQAVMEYLRREHFQHIDTNSAEWKDLSQTRLLHLLENLSYEESAKIYSRLDVKKLFDGEKQDREGQDGEESGGTEQGNEAQELEIPNEILAQARLLETEQGAKSEVFLVQLLQKSLYEKEGEEKLREQKMLWSSTVTALYQDENLVRKAEAMQIPEWSEWDFPSADVQMDFSYEHRLLRLMKQMTEEELIHLYELQKTVMAAQAVNNMLTVMKSDSLSYSRREELWKTIADAVYHNSYFSEKMKQTQETEQTTSIEPSTRLPGEMVHRYAESSMRIEETADRVLALLKSESPKTGVPETRQSAANVMPVWNLVMTKNGRLIQENIQENGELVNRWLPKQLLHTGDERPETPDYGPVSLVPGHPSAQTAPGIVQTPQMPIDIETRIERTVKERVKDINFITRRDSEVTVSKEYETKIKTLSDQVALQRQEIEEIKTGSQKLLQNTDTRKIANTVMKQLQDQLRAERLRKGL